MRPYSENKYNYQQLCYENHSYYDLEDIPVVKKKRKNVKTKRRPNWFLRALAFLFVGSLMGAYGYYVCPYNYQNYVKPLIINRFLNNEIPQLAYGILFPTKNYIYNSNILGNNVLVPYAQKSKEITPIHIVSELKDTKNKVLDLAKNYPHLEPSVFVWEYSTGAGFEINADVIYPSASIIKIPIAFELMRKIYDSSKTSNPIFLQDKRTFSEEYRTLGSGDLQKTRAGVSYSLDYLANIMIANSDNSATNMLLHEIGGMDGFNRSMRNLGLDELYMGQWLPDLEGYNKITARAISTVLYNIDNPNYINIRYKNVLKEYLGNTKNIHLIKEKLPKDVMVLHKTGDIASMLGDSGIVYTDNGKKYIVTILVKRPRNDYGAKLFIQDASLLIYQDIKALF